MLFFDIFNRLFLRKFSLVKNIQFVLSKETVSEEELAVRVLNTLSGLYKIDENLFTNWKEQSWSKKEAKTKNVEFTKDSILSIIQNEWDKKFPELGCNFSFWSGKDNDFENFVLSFSIGKTTCQKSLYNIINLSFPFSKDLQLYSQDKKLASIIKLFKNTWNPTSIKIEKTV